VPQLTGMELQLLRELCTQEQVAVAKLQDYVRRCQDADLKGFLQQLAQTQQQHLRNFAGFLH